MGKVHFILGQLGSQRTQLCYKQIKDKLKKGTHKPLILLVPEQFNLQTQRDLSEYLGSGLLDAMVMSFNTLAREIFKEVGDRKVTTIDDLERIIILKRVVEAHQKELVFYKKNFKNIGFIESINKFLTLLEQAGIEDKDLTDMHHDTKTSLLLKSKLSDILMIYKVFNDYLGTNFLTTEKHMTFLAQVIMESEKLKEAELWIDGYYGFTHPQLLIIKALMQKVKSLTITLPMDKAYKKNESIQQTHTFYESIINMQKIMAICDEVHLDYKMYYQDSLNQENHKMIYLKTFPSKMEEVKQVAKHISFLIREEGYRYRDFAIIVGDLAVYKTNLENIFNLYEIPYFLDMPYNIRTNPLTTVIETILEVITSNYSYKSMMSLLRTYMLPDVTREDIDRLENELITYNIKGKKKWQSEWTFIRDETQYENINKIREKILVPIISFEEKVKGRHKTVQHYTEALYYFLEDIKAYQTLQDRINVNKESRFLELEYTQIWNKVIEVFERLVKILGNDEMTLATYKRIVITSFSYIKMGIIPPTLDQVLIGDMERMRFHNVKACFILGTNEGVIPSDAEKTTIFSDMDKVVLQTLCDKDKGAKERLGDLLIRQPLYGDRFLIETILTKATDRLYIYAPLADEKGMMLRPSTIYFDLKKLYGEMDQPNALDVIERPLATLSYVGEQMRDYIEGRGQDRLWQDAFSFYKTSDIWKERIDTLTAYLFYTNQQHYLKPDTAKLLYGNNFKTSVSQLESFRGCACCYFLKYGIRAKERQILLNHAKIGTLFHAALERYPRELELINKTWTTVNSKERRESVYKATQYALYNISDSQKENGHFKFTASKVEKMTQRAIRALTSHLKNSAFVPESYEVQFKEKQNFPPIHIEVNETQSIEIDGTIDRIDIYSNHNGKYVKILDYKSGDKIFNLVEVYYGLQLQLLLYLDAYLTYLKGSNASDKNNAQEAGVFYFHIKPSYTIYKASKEKIKSKEKDIENKDVEQFKLSGLVLNNNEIIGALDEACKKALELVDKDDKFTSSTIPVTITKKGNIDKRSSVVTKEQFEKLREYVLNIIKKLGKEILKGKISAKPYRLDKQNACQYCAYHSICQYDERMPDNEADILEKLDKKLVLEKIEDK